MPEVNFSNEHYFIGIHNLFIKNSGIEFYSMCNITTSCPINKEVEV